MSYKLKFLPSALKEWRKLDDNIRGQLKKKLAERLNASNVPSARLRGYKDYYKIKLRSSGYRLAYRVIEHEIVVVVVGIGKRDRVYEMLKERMKHPLYPSSS